ncbi:FAD-binding oxidoreductase [Roseateles amylovorans]|uniref:FAD-binding oxidoreductase n=1 Tax=Roseateles amylovorans TaxID=2978473 RepID=A0ABY6B1W9_9BURK|nr:FAD-binding oxidoreductase [Roseateles amylovorans]UXH77974.1 FAD-binding oxidoreductase [Roseateles amylovorans]
MTELNDSESVHGTSNLSASSVSSLAHFIDQVTMLCGPTQVQVGDAIEPRFLQPARYGAGRAAVMVRPGSSAEAAAVLALASRHGRRVVLQGAHTGLVRAATPMDGQDEVLLSTDRLREVFELDLLDRSLRVSAGFRLSEVNERLAAQGLWFPVDLSADPSIGGMLAHNTGGTRMLRYGDVRANTLGLQVALAESADPAGQVVRFGQGLQKDNSALALGQLFIGSSGSLGLITEATLKLSPLPRQRAVALVAPSALDAVFPLYQAVMQRWGVLVSAFEGISRAALEAGLHGQDLSRWFSGALPDYAMLIELSSELPAEQLDLRGLLQGWLEEAFESGAVSDAVLDADEAIWGLRHRISEGLRAQGKVIGLDLSLPRRHFMSFRERGQAWLAHFPQLRLADFGHLGDGGLHFNMVWPASAGALEPAQELTLRQGLYALVAELGGSISAEHGVGPQLQAAYRAHWAQVAPGVLDWSGRVQSVFDPNRRLGNTEWGA